MGAQPENRGPVYSHREKALGACHVFGKLLRLRCQWWLGALPFRPSPKTAVEPGSDVTYLGNDTTPRSIPGLSNGLAEGQSIVRHVRAFRAAA